MALYHQPASALAVDAKKVLTCGRADGHNGIRGIILVTISCREYFHAPSIATRVETTFNYVDMGTV